MNRKIVPKTKEIEGIDLVLPEKKLLDNGIPVYIISAGMQEVSKIEFIFKAGTWYSSFPLAAKFTSDMLTAGTESYTANKIAEITDFYASDIDKDCDRDKVVVTLTCLNKHLEYILPVLQEVMFKPVFPENELSLLIQNKKQQFTLNSEKVGYLAKQKFRELLYGSKHPYGFLQKLKDYDNISRDGLKEFHKAHYSTSACWIIVSGKPDKNLLSLLNKYFGSSMLDAGSSKLDVPASSFQFPTSSFKNVIEKKNAVQCAVRIGKILFNYTHPDYYGFRILNTILGGYFGSRLMSNIREDKGYTYGINSGCVSMHNSGYFFIGSQIGKEFCKKALKEIYKEILRLQQEKVSNSELELVKNYIQGSFLRDMDGPFAQAEMVKTLIEYNLKEDYYNKYIEKIKNIKPEEITELAQKYLQIDNMYEIVVG